MKRSGILGLSIYAITLLSGFSAQASVVDTPTCKRALATLTASATKSSGVALCSAHRQTLLDTVRTRAVIAACKSGQEREADVARLDGAIETINVAVATACVDS
jgi:hypothetical protein